MNNNGNSNTILIVDDNITNFKVLVDTLQKQGFETITARNGIMGIRRAKFARPDLILLDVMMPGIDGFETCRRLKADEITRNTPIIFLTAITDTVDKVKGLDMSAVDYITKPFNMAEVIARIEKHLTIHNLRKELEEKNHQLEMEITERKQVEESLRESEERWRAITENSSDHIMLLDLEANILFINYTVPDLTEDEVIGKPVYSYVPSEFHTVMAESYKRVQETGKPDGYTTEYHTKEGKTHYFEARVRPVFKNNQVVALTVSSNNITERRLAELELAEKTMYLDNILRSSTVYAIVITDLDSRITYYNPMAEKLFDYAIAEVMGQTISEVGLIEKITSDRIEQVIKTIHQQGEYRYVMIDEKDDELRYINSRVSGIYSVDNQLVGFAFFSRDLTRQKQIEQKIKQQNQFLYTIIESLASPFYVINVKDYTIEIANSAARKKGITRLNTCYTLTHHRDTPCDSLEHPCPLVVVRQTKEPTIVEHIHYDKDNTPINVEVHGYPILNDAGEVVQMIEYSIDITKRKRAEEQLRKFSRAIEQSGSMMIITDLEGRIEFVNPSFSEITGYSYGEIIGQTPRVLKSDQTLPEQYQALWDTIKRGEVWQGELMNKKKSGELHWEYTTISPVKDKAGKTTHYLAIKDDITARKQVEEALQRSEEMFRSIGSSAQDAIVLMDIEGNISYWNEAAEKIFGYTKIEVIGQHLHNLIVPAKYHEAYEKGFSQFKKTGQGAAIGKLLELSALRNDGSEFPVEISLSAVNLKNQWNAVGIIRDITTRKQAEKALHETYDELELRVDELGTLNLIMQMLTTIPELGSALQIVVQIMTKLFNASQCGIALLNPDRTELVVTAEYTDTSPENNRPIISSIGTKIPVATNPTATQTIEERASIVVPQPQTSPLTAPMHDLMRERGSECLLVVPLLTRGRVIGTVGFHTDTVGRTFNLDEVKLAETISGQIAGVIENTRLLEAEKIANTSLSETNQHLQLLNNQMHDELSLAQEIQYSLLPPPQPDWTGLEVICFTTPAHEIGGDFYTYHKFDRPSQHYASDQRYGLAVGDVSGKGVSAALLMAASLSQLEAMYVYNYPPAKRLAYLDEAIMHYTKSRRQNCALCYVEIKPASDGYSAQLEIVNAGCIPPYIKRTDGSVEHPEIGGFALGQGLGSTTTYQQQTIELQSGDMVILTSDGVVEANNSVGEMLGFERLEQIVRDFNPEGLNQNGAEAMLDHLKQAVFAFTDKAEQHDDMTMVVVRV
ncbi:PAS domain S-box protein [Anaerolineales bacterium HSG25]|nr:PAS domain S-box protein [Anaerolineales bacterium HSG25]